MDLETLAREEEEEEEEEEEDGENRVQNRMVIESPLQKRQAKMPPASSASTAKAKAKKTTVADKAASSKAASAAASTTPKAEAMVRGAKGPTAKVQCSTVVSLRWKIGAFVHTNEFLESLSVHMFNCFSRLNLGLGLAPPPNQRPWSA